MALPLVGVNLLYVRPGYVGGTVRYAEQLLSHLARSDRFRLKLYVQAGAFPTRDPAILALPRTEFRIRGGVAMRVLVEQLVLPGRAERDGVDLLFSPGFVSPLRGAFAKVVTIHDLYYLRFPQFVRPWQRRYWQAFIPPSLRAVDAAITVSDSTRADLVAAFPWCSEKTDRILLGGDALPLATPPDPRPAPYALVVGNVTPNKNIETVVAAFARLAASGTACRLVVAGSDPSGALARALDAAQPRPDVTMLTHIDDASLARLYAGATCLIQASHYEGFGLPVAEAMTAGCAVVASDIGVLREIGGDAALYFPTTDADALAHAVRALATDETTRRHRADACRIRAQQFRWRDVAKRTGDLFDAVLARRP